MTRTAGFKIPLAIESVKEWEKNGTLLEHLRNVCHSFYRNVFGEKLKGYHLVSDWEISDVIEGNPPGTQTFLMIGVFAQDNEQTN